MNEKVYFNGFLADSWTGSKQGIDINDPSSYSNPVRELASLYALYHIHYKTML